MRVSLKARKVLPLCLLALSLLAFGPGLSFVQAKPSQRKGAATACASNLKNMATAMEMYSTDWAGKYPPSKRHLVPNYLKTLPACPVAKKDTYRVQLGPKAPGNSQGFRDYYLLSCQGRHHSSEGYPQNFPKYTSIQGVRKKTL